MKMLIRIKNRLMEIGKPSMDLSRQDGRVKIYSVALLVGVLVGISVLIVKESIFD